MPYEPLPGRPLVALAASLAAVLVVYVVRPVSGADGSLLASFVPLVAAARFGGWREALCVVWSATLAVQFSPPPEIPIDVPGVPENRWIPAAVWGLVYAAAGTAGCLTLRRQVESDVERARGAIRDRFRALIGSNFLPMFMGTIDGRVTEANAAWNRVAGVPSRDGRLMRWDGLAATGSAASPLVGPEMGHTARIGVVYRHSGREDVHGDLFLIRTSAGSGEVCGMFFDQTDARKTEGALRREADGLIEADGRKDEALAILAHELRNPLAPIVTSAELIRRATDDDSRHRCSRIIEGQAKILSRLADDLMDVCRLSRNTITIKKETVDLSELVSQAAENIRPETEKLRHELFVSCPLDGPVYAEADATRMGQVLNNLLSNAAKYTPAGGTIYLTLERAPGAAVISVRDNGNGITPEFLPRVWDIFVQHRTGLDRSGGGIGIGLTLVKRLVELHGGTVRAASDGDGKGAEFVVTIPRPVLSWKSHPRPASAPAPSKSPRKILLVEDNFAAAETTAELLEIEGHKVTVVHEGSAAIATCGALHPDVILLDIGLPGMNGYETARQIRKNGCQAVIVAITGCTTDENHTAGFEAGIDHYLHKPVSFDSLRDILASPRPRPGCGIGYEGLSLPTLPR